MTLKGELKHEQNSRHFQLATVNLKAMKQVVCAIEEQDFRFSSKDIDVEQIFALQCKY